MARLTHVLGILRAGLVSGIMRELDQRQSAPVMDLRREHEADLFRCHFGFQVDHTLDILYRIPVAVPVSQAAVDKGGRPRPDEGHKAVIGVPDVDHGVKFRAGRLYTKMREAFSPVGAQSLELSLPERRIRFIFLKDRGALFGHLFSQDKQDRPGLSCSQRELGRDGTAAVAVIVCHIAEVAPLDTLRISVPAPGPQESRLVAAPGGSLRPGHAKKALSHRLTVRLLVPGQSVKVAMELLPHAAAFKECPGDKKRVLQIHQILLIIAVVRELSVSCQCQISRSAAGVDDSERPDLMALSERHIIYGLTMDPAVVRHDICVAGSVAALAAVF